MPDWLGYVLSLLAVGSVFWLLFYLLKHAQEGDASKRGQDSAEPGGFSGHDPD